MTTSAFPALFISHGSPDTAIADTHAAAWLRQMAADLPRPRAIVVASAHFEVSGGVAVSADPDPETIHDFRGLRARALRHAVPGAGRAGPGAADHG
jgi:4,5-DOPA dioxygenase extradiol